MKVVSLWNRAETLCSLRVKERESERISAGADGGPHSWICACLPLHSAPHQHQRVCKVTFKHLPKPLRSHTQSFNFWNPPFDRPRSIWAKFADAKPSLGSFTVYTPSNWRIWTRLTNLKFEIVRSENIWQYGVWTWQLSVRIWSWEEYKWRNAPP